MKYYLLMFAFVLAFVCVTPYVYGILPSELKYTDGKDSSDYGVFYPDTSEGSAVFGEERVASLLASLVNEKTHPEAIKAMAIVLRTREAAGRSAELSPDTYIPDSVKNAVSETSGMVIEYGGGIIDAEYYIPSNDPFCKSYTADEFKNLLSENGISVYENTSHKSWLTYVSRKPSGRIKRVFICGTELSGEDFADILGIDSENIEMETTEKGFVFTFYGSEKGKGLSLAGVIEMAEDGESYDKIIYHYFNGAYISFG